MNELLNSELVEKLAQTLLNSIWQAGLVYAFLKIVLLLFPKSKARVRYGFGIGALLIFLIINLMSFDFSNEVVSASSTKWAVDLSSQSLSRVAENSIPEVVGLSGLAAYLPYFIIFWWAGVLFFSLRFTIGVYSAQKLCKSATIEVPEEIHAKFMALKKALKVSKRTTLAISEKIYAPMVIGFVKPIVLFPVGMINGLTVAEVEAILIHELSHIRRHDYLVNIMQSLMEIVYFFNPFIWLISKEIREEREHACDDNAIALGVSQLSYVETLALVYEHAYKNKTLAISFATRKNLTLKRIRRIMKTQSNNNKFLATLPLALLVSMLIYLGAESHAPVGQIPFYSPERLIVASPIMPLNNISTEVLAELKFKFDREKNELQPLMQQDTIDEKMLKLKARQYEEAVAKLRSTKEWQELESLKAEMIAEQLKQLEDMGPIIEDALRSVELETAFDEINLKELKEQMAQLEIQLGENRVNEDIQRVMEKSARVFEESMAEVEARMAEINVEELEDLAQEQIIKAEKYAREAELMARNAEKIASEAKKIAQRAEKFFDELKPELIKDGYINNNEDLDDLRFEDGKVYVNDVEVKSKDAKKYYEIRDRHLGKDTSFFTN